MAKPTANGFFGNFEIQETEDITTSEIKEEIEKEEPLEEKEEVILEDEPKGETSKEVETEKETEEEEEFSFTPFVEAFSEKGILYIDPEKEYDDNEDGFEEVISDTINKRFEEKISSLDPKLQRIFTLAQKGASIDELFAQTSEIDYNDIDLSDPENQLMLIEEHLLATGYEADEVPGELEKIKDLGEEEKRAKVAQKYLAKGQKKKLEDYEATVEANRLKEEAAFQKEVEEFKDFVLSTQDLDGFKITKKQSQELYDFITKPVNKKGQTKIQVEDSKKKQLKAAYLRMIDFDFSNIERKAETKATQKIKNAVKRYTDPNAKSKVGQPITEHKEKIKIPSFFGSGDSE